MSGTHRDPALTSYRDAVTELCEAGKPFGDIEAAINDVADLTTDQKAALWLFAFSHRDQAEHQHEARTHLATVQ